MEHGPQFLHQKDSKLHTSQPVGHEHARSKRAGETTSQKPAAKLDAWLEILERTHTGKGASEARLAAQPIVLERIKESYRKPASEGGYITGTSDRSIGNYLYRQAEVAHRQGHGDTAEIMRRVNPQVEAEARATIVTDQTRSLDRWVDYLSSDDAGYPAWFKYYTFRNITKLSTYDKEKTNGKDKATGEERPKGGFPARSADTTAPFPDINREALAYMEDSLAKHYGLKTIDPDNPNDQIDEKTLHVLNNDSSFASLYKRAIEYAAPKHAENLNVSDGAWVKYEQTDDQAKSDELAHSLHGYGTGWCTAGEGMAHSQLSGGDFYVYYTKGEDGQHSVPRVAIRMENEGGQQSIHEVRGIEAEQNLEGVLTDIAEAKMYEVDPEGAETYAKKVSDMRRLTEIENLMEQAPLTQLKRGGPTVKDYSQIVLSKEQIRFLYEVDSPIESFGYERDKRIGRILEERRGMDWKELMEFEAEVLPEKLIERFNHSFESYKNIVEQLNEVHPERAIDVLTNDQALEMFKKQLHVWGQNGTLAWVAEKIIKEHCRHDLVITPNVLIGIEDVNALGENFSRKLDRWSEYTWGLNHFELSESYDKYTDEELSGVVTDTPIRFSLIPEKHSTELGEQSPDELLLRLETMKATNPTLNLHVPSVLDTFVYWEMLDLNLDDTSSYYDETDVYGNYKYFDYTTGIFDVDYIAYINLNTVEINGKICIPFSHPYYQNQYYDESTFDDTNYQKIGFTGSKVKAVIAVG